MYVREYEDDDCKYIIELFLNTVRNVNIKDYTKNQINAWTNRNMDISVWLNRLSRSHCIVVIYDNKIIGFGDINLSGYLDHLYVHKDHQRADVATTIANILGLYAKIN